MHQPPLSNIRGTLKPIGCLLIVVCFFLSMPVAAWPADGLTQEKIPADLNPVFEYLMAFNRPDGGRSVDAAMINRLVTFVLAPKSNERLYYTDGLFDMTSAYHGFVLDTDLTRILKLSYNPGLPSFFTNPSSIRLSYWTGFEDGRDAMPKLWHSLSGDQLPLVVRGHEIVENTPDLNTGGYYRYGLDRTLILTKHRDNNLLISLSKQTDISEVGKKGLVLGSDEDWTYLYSGEKGLNKAGLGWIKSYMYDSFSVVVYYEMPGQTARVKCGVFKWINAGWRKINMVKEHHIHGGLLRFAQDFKAVVEEPSLPEAAALAETFAGIQALATDDLQQLNLAYLKAIRERHAGDKTLASGWVADAVSDGHVERMDQREMRAVVILDYIRNLLGKPHYLDVSKLTVP